MCGRICSSITTRLLSVAKAAATVSLSGLQKPPLSPAPQLRAFQDLGLCPLLSGALALRVSPLVISRPSSLVSSSSLPFSTHYPQMAQVEVWRAWSPED